MEAVVARLAAEALPRLVGAVPAGAAAHTDAAGDGLAVERAVAAAGAASTCPIWPSRPQEAGAAYRQELQS